MQLAMTLRIEDYVDDVAGLWETNGKVCAKGESLLRLMPLEGENNDFHQHPYRGLVGLSFSCR